MLYDDFLNAAFVKTPEELALIVQELTTDSIDRPPIRQKLLNDCMMTALSLIKRYNKDLEDCHQGRSVSEPKSITGMLYKATYLYETVFTLSGREGVFREIAQSSAAMAYESFERLQTSSPEWTHDFPLSERIARLSNG